MKGGWSKGRASLLLAVAALAVVAGCGGSGSDEVTVQTGSLSKAEFIKKADAICEAARTEFLAKYTKFLETHKSAINAGKPQQEALLTEIVESILAPNIEGQIEQISGLGAPKAYAPEVAKFLNALQKRIEKGKENPNGLLATTTPFVLAENIARRAAMNGCAESFS